MIYNLSTNDYRLDTAFRFIDDITSNNYYFFISNYLPQSNTSLQPVYDNTSNTVTMAWRDMIQGIKITANDAIPVINNVLYQSNTVYTQYDDINPNLINENFFVITLEGSFYHIWKCLYNFFGSPSTVQPLFSYLTDAPTLQTADNYVWKLMSTIQDAVAIPFETSDYFPIVANTGIAQNAVPGAIDIFIIESNGSFYDNYVTGSLTSTDISVEGNPQLFNISNNMASPISGFYTGCLFYLTSGQGQGQWANIINYTANSLGNIIETDIPFVVGPQNSTTYQISPQALIVSDGSQTVNCVAVALVNSLASNSVYAIEVLQRGAGYNYVANVSLSANVAVGISNNCMLRAVLPPPGGHGSNAYSELYCNSVTLGIVLSNNESNTLLVTNEYQQIGIMEDPLFANVTFSLSGENGVFELGETVYSYTFSQIANPATVTVNSTTISCNTANFINQLATANLFLVSSANSNITQLVQVNSIANNSTVTVASNLNFSCSAAILYSVVLTGNAIVTSPGSSNVVVTNCTPTFFTGTSVVGVESGTTGTVMSIARNGVSGTFQTFVQLTRYTATLQSGIFQQDETLTQGNNSASLFAVANGGGNSITLYVSEFINGRFVSNNIVTGSNSGATALIGNTYIADLVENSAHVLYLENISPITRANNQQETFLVTFNF